MHPDPLIKRDLMVAWIKVQAEMPPNVKVIIIQGLRSFAESDHDYALGRTIINPDGKSAKKPMGNIITWAQAGESYHNYGLAFDFAMVTDGRDDYQVGPVWMRVVKIMADHGWEWGGSFPKGKTDNPHFQKRLGCNWRLLKIRHDAGDFIPGTNYVKL